MCKGGKGWWCVVSEGMFVDEEIDRFGRREGKRARPRAHA